MLPDLLGEQAKFLKLQLQQNRDGNMEKLKWGVIAAGGIADRRMIPAMIKTPESELIAVMDADGNTAKRVADKYDVPHYYDNVDDLLANNEIEAVYIASPVFCHKEQAIKAADAGKHILLEKPIAMNASDAEEVVEYCKKKNVRLAAGFMMRFATLHQRIKQMLDEGHIGQLVYVYAHFSCWYPDMEGAWRQYKALSGGGALMDMGLHLIDLTQYISGSRIKEVAAMNETIKFSYEVEDSSSLLARFDNGMVGSLNANFNIPDSAARWQISFFGTKGRIIGDTTIGQEDGGKLLVIRENSDMGYVAQQDASTAKEEVIKGSKYGDLYQFELKSFTDSVLNNKPLVCDGEQAVYSQKVTDAAYKSSLTKQFIYI